MTSLVNHMYYLYVIIAKNYVIISIILMKNRKNEQKPLYNEENGLY